MDPKTTARMRFSNARNSWTKPTTRGMRPATRRPSKQRLLSARLLQKTQRKLTTKVLPLASVA